MKTIRGGPKKRTKSIKTPLYSYTLGFKDLIHPKADQGLTQGWPKADPQTDPQADPKADLWRGRSRISFLTTTMRSPPISWRPAAEIRVKGSVSRDFPPQIIKTLLPLLHYKKNGIGSLHERLWKTTFFLSFNLNDSNYRQLYIQGYFRRLATVSNLSNIENRV